MKTQHNRCCQEHTTRTRITPPVAHQLPLRIEQRAIIATAVAPDRLTGRVAKVFGFARRDHAGDRVPLRAPQAAHRPAAQVERLAAHVLQPAYAIRPDDRRACRSPRLRPAHSARSRDRAPMRSRRMQYFGALVDRHDRDRRVRRTRAIGHRCAAAARRRRALASRWRAGSCAGWRMDAVACRGRPEAAGIDGVDSAARLRSWPAAQRSAMYDRTLRLK
jgi:hypothetical protein